MTWTPVCEVCHGRPKMDRCVCCEGCWYSGRYARWFDDHARNLDPRWLIAGDLEEFGLRQ